MSNLETSNRDEWSPLHHLAYVYAAIATVDGSVADEELEVLCDKLHQWNPGIAGAELMKTLMTAVTALGSDLERGDTAPFHASVEAVARTFEPGARAAALDDLLAIAGADGVVRSGEGDLLLAVRKAWSTDRAAGEWRNLPEEEAG